MPSLLFLFYFLTLLYAGCRTGDECVDCKRTRRPKCYGQKQLVRAGKWYQLFLSTCCRCSCYITPGILLVRFYLFCFLLIYLQAHPDWTPRMIKESLQMTASQASSPDIFVGWGIADALSAITYTPNNEST
jgi:hypothetical protein